jgi:uncharacterized protein
MAAQITPSQLEVYRKSAREREFALKMQLAERRLHAYEVAKQAAIILKEEFGASRVVLFGSLLHPERFHWRSDIDLAVWDVHKYFRAVSRLLDIDSQFEFDLIPIEDARPVILNTIQEEGVDL